VPLITSESEALRFAARGVKSCLEIVCFQMVPIWYLHVKCSCQPPSYSVHLGWVMVRVSGLERILFSQCI